MGRFDPTYDDHTRARIAELINDEGLSYGQATQTLEAETGIAMPVETARKIAGTDRRRRVPKLEDDNPIAPMVKRLLSLCNEELHTIEVKKTKSDNDLDRAAKVAKLLLDADKLRKANQAKPKADDDNPLAALKPKQASQEKSGSVAGAHGPTPSPPPSDPLAALAA
jgi:hypothetical protein